MGILDLAAANLLSPMILFFALGMAAAAARSDLSIPEAVAKGMSLYLIMAIGFKGGAGVAAYGLDGKLIAAMIAGVILSALMPVIAMTLLMRTTKLPRVDAAAVAAHYGSISIVTFLAAGEMAASSGIPAESFMVAVAAAMETPAIFAGLIMAQVGIAAKTATADATAYAHTPAQAPGGFFGGLDKESLREVALNGSIVMLIGAFAIGCITGEDGLEAISPFIVSPFKGVLCLFLLDMGLIAGRGLREGARTLSWPVLLFGLYMPLIGATLGAIAGVLCGLSAGGTALMMTLSASASYIAVPAAMRLALPEARASIYLPLSLGVTFPFNLVLGIPLYVATAQAISA
ncbi:MAG: sodium-dependent bicarbonate transport family permease [Pseudomonadota bacterium]